MKNTHLFKGIWIVFACIVLGNACNTPAKQEEKIKSLAFGERLIADSLVFLWSRYPIDLTGDSLDDIAFTNNNAHGGSLGYFEGNADAELWMEHIIASTAPNGISFAAGDMECSDVDADGDVDIFGIAHIGEWEWDKPEESQSVIYWYENPEWEAHVIGEAPEFVKEISAADFDKDGFIDVCVLTFDKPSLSIFQQNPDGEWEKVQFFENYKGLHEGMELGDIDGDGNIDIVATGFVFFNPGNDLKSDWTIENMDKKWNSQEGDWSRNATKIFVRDINDDQKDEVFIGHSERAGYPLAWYQRDDNGEWQENIIKDSIPACHTIQVYDFDRDGNYDVLAGINKGRAIDLGKENFDVTIFLGEEGYMSWEPLVIEENGIYNGQVSDFEKDGDPDIFRYQTHDATKLYLLKNQLKE